MAPRARIHTVEAAPDTFAVLVGNIEANGLGDRVTCHQAAVTGRSGVAELALAPASACDSLVPTPGEDLGGSVVVRTMSLDDVVSCLPRTGRIHLKVDAEGSEFEMFATASESVLDRIAFLALECHTYKADPGREHALVRRLEAAGFRLRHVREGEEHVIFGYR